MRQDGVYRHGSEWLSDTEDDRNQYNSTHSITMNKSTHELKKVVRVTASVSLRATSALGAPKFLKLNSSGDDCVRSEIGG